MYCFFFFDLQFTGLIQKEQNSAISKRNPQSIFVQPVELFSARMYRSAAVFKPGCIPLEDCIFIGRSKHTEG